MIVAAQEIIDINAKAERLHSLLRPDTAEELEARGMLVLLSKLLGAPDGAPLPPVTPTEPAEPAAPAPAADTVTRAEFDALTAKFDQLAHAVMAPAPVTEETPPEAPPASTEAPAAP